MDTEQHERRHHDEGVKSIESIGEGGDAADAVLSLQKVQSAVSIDVDYESRTIFWSDITSDTISRAGWNGTDQLVVVGQPLESPAGVAVDWIGRNLYWTDSGT